MTRRRGTCAPGERNGGTRGDRLPDGFALRVDDATRWWAPARVVAGGAPAVAARLSPGAAAQYALLARGATVGEVAAATGADPTPLARLLLDRGLAHPCPDHTARVGHDDITVVVPVLDRAHALPALLTALGTSRVVVVDDGSSDGSGDVAAAHGAVVVRRGRPSGAAAARNAGLELVTTPLVAFLDADCHPPPGWLAPVAAHLADPSVAFAAPRVTGAAGRSLLERYDAARSALDLGAVPAPVDPHGRVAFVPSAALVARTATLREIGGFDDELRYGEDQDLCWRLLARGWRGRYEPSVVVGHDARTTARAFFARRAGYGTPLARLASRHPHAVSGARVSPGVLAAGALALAGYRRAAAATVVVSTAGTARSLVDVGVPAADAARLATRSSVRAARGLAAAMTSRWLPATVLAATRSRRVARYGAGALALRHLARRPATSIGPAAWLGLSLADDTAVALGVWTGVAGTGHLGALAPRWPRPDAGASGVVERWVVAG